MKKNLTIKRAQGIRQRQKEDYQNIFRREVKRKGMSSINAAVSAGSKYRSKYGSTATDRWLKALEEAKQSINKAVKAGKAAAKKRSVTSRNKIKTNSRGHMNLKGVVPKSRKR